MKQVPRTVWAGCIQITAPAYSQVDLARTLHRKYGFTTFYFDPPEMLASRSAPASGRTKWVASLHG